MNGKAPCALVVEGGAMRGVFAAAVLEAFIEEGFHPFDHALGVSVGAHVMMTYLARQRGRARRCFFGPMRRREFIDPLRLLRGGHAMDLDWLMDVLEREAPLDVQRAAASGVRYAVVATSLETGHPVYLEPSADEMQDALKASSAMPLYYRDVVQVRGEPLFDGAFSDPLPVREAYRRGARRIVVVRSRPSEEVTPRAWLDRLAALALRAPPAVARAVAAAPAVYEASMRFVRDPPSDCQVVEIAPPAPLATRRATRDARALARDFALGHAIGSRVVREWAHDEDMRR